MDEHPKKRMRESRKAIQNTRVLDMG